MIVSKKQQIVWLSIFLQKPSSVFKITTEIFILTQITDAMTNINDFYF